MRVVKSDSNHGDVADSVLNREGKPQDRYISANVSDVIGENTRKVLKNKQRLRKVAEPLIQTSDGRVFIKEGTILGRTYTDNGFEERRIRDEDTAVVRPCLEARIENKTIPNLSNISSTKTIIAESGVLSNLEPNEYPTGNYMRIILRTAEDGGKTNELESMATDKDNIIDDCEDYIDIDKIEGASNITKVLYMGDSQMYSNDIGGQFTALARKANRNVIAVCAYNDGASLDYIDNGKKLKAACWITRDGKMQLFKGKGDIHDIMSEDYGSIDRARKWDYIVVPSGSVNKVKDLFNYMRRSLSDPKNFVIWCKDDNPQTYEELAKELKCSVVCTGAILNNYEQQDLLTITGGKPSGVKQYISACTMYAKIFGKSDLSMFINLFNAEDGSTSDFYKIAEYDDGGNRNKCDVNEIRAREIQKLVIQHYEDGVLAIN